MHSHHSHSGDYVSHATDTLDTIVARVIEMKFDTFCLTEHQPRLNNKYLYPEENDKEYNTDDLKKNFDDYYKHAKEIQKNSKSNTKILVGFESEAIDEEHIDYSLEILKNYQFDMFVGSIHFVKSIPIDFDKSCYNEAIKVCNNSIYELFDEYFELQYLMLRKLKPLVVGHFDLIYLMCDDSIIDSKTGISVKKLNLLKYWPKIWEKIIRNIKFVKSYKGLFELNSASYRKGWNTAYPSLEIALAIVEFGDGRFCLSDDSHAIKQVGLNYDKTFNYVINDLNLQKIYYLDLENHKTMIKEMNIEVFKNHEFWKQYSEV